MIDPTDPFFAPLWRRIVIVALCLGWALFEVATGSPGWALMFGAAGAYAAFKLLGPGYRRAHEDKDKNDG
ncbi:MULTISPECIES: hypothetical protein [Donghicola]|jgi:hypothetical protein|uniref:DUF3329 domain-containing protein n=1 Tax=Donghicola eburneus TaxID=393278 RepID=A0A1M4MVR9_9RHOB|nr:MULTISPECIES: hypothetical protein [Donghicola]MCT4577093.1 hypothetical protein [Donghicola sp.]SCM66560.1 hypothetical protein KARMA_0738 [Donghicola eburneus]SFQ75715.1 hypothetical protein SAMN05421764_11645 [Donghicola eburneus]